MTNLDTKLDSKNKGLTQAKWEKEFDEIWNNYDDYGYHDTDKQEVIDFIHKTLAHRTSTIIERVEFIAKKRKQVLKELIEHFNLDIDKHRRDELVMFSDQAIQEIKKEVS